MVKEHAARAVGLAGSVLVALGGLGAGALPVGAASWDGWRHPRLGLVGVYTGLALLLLGWWWYGRLVRARRDDSDGRGLWVTLALWVAPLLIAPPLFSRDVYSYLAQGSMIDSGLDVYRHGPAVLGGLLAEQVPAIWQQTPSPYGPLFLIVAKAIAGLLSAHLILGVLALRLVAVAGLALLAWSVRVLAAEAGVRVASATWLAVLNPLVLIHLVGGAHNDALMVGLLAAGLALAVRNKLVLGTLLVVAAALVKVPAALGLFAVLAIWTARRTWVQAAAGIAATALVATVAITAVSGTGYGWIAALDTPISPQNWSLTSMLGRWTGETNLWRGCGVLATLAVAGAVWTYRARLGPVYGLGIVLVALVLFGPAIRPWYVLWGLVPLAVATEHHRVRRLLAACCTALVLVVLPDGFAADGERVLLAVLGSLLGIAVFLVVQLALTPALAVRNAR